MIEIEAWNPQGFMEGHWRTFIIIGFSLAVLICLFVAMFFVKDLVNRLATLFIAPFILGSVMCLVLGSALCVVVIATNTQPKPERELREVYDLQSIKTVQDASLRRSLLLPGEREGLAVEFITNDGVYYDNARIVFETVDENAEPGQISHRAWLEVRSEESVEWEPFDVDEEAPPAPPPIITHSQTGLIRNELCTLLF